MNHHPTKFQILRTNRKKCAEVARRCHRDPEWWKQEEEILREPDSRIMYDKLAAHDPRADIPSWGELARRVFNNVVAAFSQPHQLER